MTEALAAELLKALSDETRIKILKMLSESEMCAAKILEQFSITQPTLSHHMKLLCDTALVNYRKDGKWTYYSLNRERLFDIFTFFGEEFGMSENLTFSRGYENSRQRELPSHLL
ncbi:MAG: metalloregulator ArsR/SmtB family transcription factor [Oscillospiraceae bacterium]|nr:metalloregulator ArsR/SmtB family transcription factor [Oscillospiraceae bacterium]